jgi:hypothetical protein
MLSKTLLNLSLLYKIPPPIFGVRIEVRMSTKHSIIVLRVNILIFYHSYILKDLLLTV